MKFFDPRGDIEKTAHKLPHWQQGEVAIFVTFRLADSLPSELLDDLLRARDAFLTEAESLDHPRGEGVGSR